MRWLRHRDLSTLLLRQLVCREIMMRSQASSNPQKDVISKKNRGQTSGGSSRALAHVAYTQLSLQDLDSELQELLGRAVVLSDARRRYSSGHSRRLLASNRQTTPHSRRHSEEPQASHAGSRAHARSSCARCDVEVDDADLAQMTATVVLRAVSMLIRCSLNKATCYVIRQCVARSRRSSFASRST